MSGSEIVGEWQRNYEGNCRDYEKQRKVRAVVVLLYVDLFLISEN